MKAHRLMLALMIVMVSAMAVSVCAAEDSDAAAGTDLRVFIEAENGEFRETLVDSANTVKELITKASENLGMPIEYDRNGVISKVGNRAPHEGEYWNIHQWMPLGVHDWDSVGFDEKSDSQILPGASFCLHRSSQNLVNNKTVYEMPIFEPKSYGYFFIRFYDDYDVPNPEVQKAFDADVRQNGFWLKGYGSNMGEVIEDAMNSNEFECEFKLGLDGNGNDLQYWFISFFGLGDEKCGKTPEGIDIYKYWSQFCYVKDAWGYNEYTMGYYDPGVYKYAGCIRYTSDDKLDPMNMDLPDIDRDPITPMKSRLEVSFEVDGVKIGKTHYVWYGNSLNQYDIPEYVPEEGMVFSGWGDVTAPIKEDTVFRATTHSKTDEIIVRYFDEAGNILLHTETVMYGESARYDGRPKKSGDVSADYVFKGWSKSLDNVIEDTDVCAIYETHPKKYPVRFYGFGNELIQTEYVQYGHALTEIPEGPDRLSTVDKVFSFVGWSSTPFEYVQADFSKIIGLKVVYAIYDSKPREYDVSLIYDGKILDVKKVAYGAYIGESVIMDTFTDAHAAIYLDAEMKQCVNAYFTVYGDICLHVEKVPGAFAYKEENGRIDKDMIDVSFPDSGGLPRSDGQSLTVCDISGLFKDKSVYISSDILKHLTDEFGTDLMFGFSFARGDLYADSDCIRDRGDLTLSLNKGPTSALRITAALKKVNCDSSFTISVNLGGHNIYDLQSEQLLIHASIPFQKDEGENPPMAWSANPSTGKLTELDCTLVDEHVVFRLGVLPYVATGTSHPRVTVSEDDTICPYGEVLYNTFGTDATTYKSELVSMIVDNNGRVLHVPSSFEGYALKRICDGAFRGVIDAKAIVIPCTVNEFHWGAISGNLIADIYFMGDVPVFTGERPSDVTVHYAGGSSGWDDATCVPFTIYEYAKDGFVFRYYCIDGEITVCEYVSGSRVDIPDIINVNGMDCIVTSIGCESFRDSSADYIRLPDSVRDIQSRAFYGSSVKSMVWSENIGLKYIGDEAFRNCEFMRTVSLPYGLLYIGFESFRKCSMLYSADIPDSVRMIGDGAYYICEKLSDVRIGTGVENIPSYCFAYCVLLDNVTFPDSVSKIGNNAFLKCGQLSFIDLNKVTAIGGDAFRLCTTLDTVVFGESLRTVSAGCLAECPLLKEIEAYCPEPEDFDKAFSVSSQILPIPDGVRIYVDAAVDSGWSCAHEIIPEIDDLKSTPDNHLDVVIGSMILFFILMGLLSYMIKVR